MAAESACPQRRAVPKSLTEMGFRVVTVMLIKFGIVRFWANRLQRYIKAANPPNLKTLIIYKSSILAHFAIFVHDKVFTRKVSHGDRFCLGITQNLSPRPFLIWRVRASWTKVTNRIGFLDNECSILETRLQVKF